MKAQYEAPRVQIEEFCFTDTIGLSAEPPLGYDDTEGWSPIKPLP